MTEQVRTLLNDKHKGMVVVKTASQMGDNAVYSTFADYTDEHPYGEAHRIIEIDLVDELKGINVEVEYNMFGIPYLIIGSEELSVSKFFSLYQY